MEERYNTLLKYYIHDSYDIDEVFIKIIKDKHFKMAKWLYSLNYIDTHKNNDYVFRWSCDHGYFKMAKWLYSLGDVDIHIYDEYAFRWSCINGQFKIAKWLYSLDNIDIHIYDEFMFRYLCKNGHFKIAKWLYSFADISNKYLFDWSHINNNLKKDKRLSFLCISYKDKQYFNTKKIISKKDNNINIIYKPQSKNYMKILSLYNNKIYKI